jgi:iron complex transport system permease protein
LLGVSAGAALGAILAIFFSLSIVALQGLAFLGGVVSVALVYGIGARLRGHDQTISLVLAGIAVGALLSAAISLLKVTADPYDQLLGSLAAINVSDLWVATPAIVLGLAPLFSIRWRINLLTLPEDEARAIGLNTRRYRLVVIAGATLATAGAVSISGIIGWVGLLVPHIARLIVGPDYQRLLPISAILGAAFLIAVDTAARSLTAVEIPIGILTAVLGTPFFVWLLASSRTGWQ